MNFTSGEKVPLGGPNKNCNNPCKDEEGVDCVTDYDFDTDQPYYVCLMGSCLVTSSEDTVKFYTESERGTILFKKLYKFRDSYLTSSSKGLGYIDDYYKLSKESVYSFSFSSLYAISVLSPSLLSKFDKLVEFKEVDPSIGAEILYDAQFRDDVVLALDQLINDLPLNSESRNILLNVKSDVILLKGKTIAEIDAIMSS
ncbi:hypothetical protein FUA23_22170 [Neolewinella aurantiaca]|uniref:Uncharacterized protein n=1 Tax=Neolewinella aurantiaca TaxID=2602767 RepID=A0A5C7EYW0_9BACT|nr:hypothetical protein [Neolewinella aurantiaca]TXF80801.1 hypothetical protein FUA23_22170 [Neolewinella aurantiaca]